MSKHYSVIKALQKTPFKKMPCFFISYSKLELPAKTHLKIHPRTKSFN